MSFCWKVSRWCQEFVQTKVENNKISITKNIHIVEHGDFNFKFDVVRCVGCFRRKTVIILSLQDVPKSGVKSLN